jgi:hypothetical protein
MHQLITRIVLSCELFLLVTSSLNSQAQDISEKFGQISMGELLMTKCSRDTSAEAYVLFDKGKSVFVQSGSGGFDIYYDRQCRIKILSENGYGFADISIPLYQENNIYERLESIEAYTYNLNGTLIERTALDPKNIYEEKVSVSFAKKKFALPKVKVGSIIEYKYRVSTPYVFNLPSWGFQWEIPVRYSEYEVHMVPFYDYSYILQGAKKFDVYSSEEDKGIGQSFAGINYHDMVYIYGMKNLHAFHNEAYISCPRDYLLKIIFQLSSVIHPDGVKVNYITTWNLLVKDILKNEDLGRFLRSGNSQAKKIIDGLNLTIMPAEEKVKAIVDYVKNNFKWDDETSLNIEKSVKKFIDDKSGNSSEINLFLVSLLNAAGIESYPLLISTRDHGVIRYEYPFVHYFNNLIVAIKINNKYTLTDGTDPRSSYNHIPVECINDKGLLLRKDDPVEWVNLASDITSDIREKLDISISKNLVNCKLKLKATDYDSYEYYRNYYNKSEAVENSFLQKGYSSADSILLETDPNSLDTFNMKLNLVYKLDNSGKFIYLSPLLQEPLLKSPFKSPDRTYPVDFTYLIKREYTANINIPEGYSVQSVPAKIFYDNKDYYVFYEAKVSENRIIVTANYMFKRTVFQPNEYRTIKFIMQNVVDKFNEKIVLIKQ